MRRWLFGVSHHAFFRIQEREQRVVLSSDGGDAELETMGAVMGHVAAQRTGLDAFVCRIDVGPAIREAIEQLAAPYRAAVTLVDVEGLSYEEAAQVADGDAEDRMQAGLTLLQMWRSADNASAVVCLFEVNDRKHAEAWVAKETGFGAALDAEFLKTA